MEIAELRDVSGVGTYATTVNLPTVDGAYLDLGEVGGTVRITVNGHRLRTIDPSQAACAAQRYGLIGPVTLTPYALAAG